jgi:tRNA-intron endonuclease
LQGELVGNRIVLWDIAQARQAFREGFYGKPLGISKPKNAEFNAPLVLDLIEGYYMALNGKLNITQPPGETAVTVKQIEKICRREYVDFDEKFLVYRELRESGLVVSPGIKFGCDFAVYEHGPGIDHAPYLVQVVKPDKKLAATDIILAGRLATTVKKQFILAAADFKKKRINFISFDWWRT